MFGLVHEDSPGKIEVGTTQDDDENGGDVGHAPFYHNGPVRSMTPLAPPAQATRFCDHSRGWFPARTPVRS